MAPFWPVLGNSVGRKSFKTNGRLLPYFHGMKVPNSVPQRFPKPVPVVPVTNEVHDYANSNSIFFAARSRFTIRKLRTCPARMGSALGDPPPPLFQRACSIELKAERSAFDSCGASIFILAGVAAVILQEA